MSDAKELAGKALDAYMDVYQELLRNALDDGLRVGATHFGSGPTREQKESAHFSARSFFKSVFESGRILSGLGEGETR